MVVSILVGRSLSFVNAHYNAYVNECSLLLLIRQMWSPQICISAVLKIIIKEHLHVSFDKTAQQNSCMQLQIVCLVSINCNELRY